MDSTYLIVALLITMLGRVLLGMALLTVAAYLVADVPSVLTPIGLDIQPLQANMFILYFGTTTQVMPSVCTVLLTAAGIAGVDLMKTGPTGLAYAPAAFLVPFIFTYDPSMLLIGVPLEIVKRTLIPFLGTYLPVSGTVGFSPVPLNRIEGTILFVSAILITLPETTTDIIGIVVVVAFFVICSAEKRKFYSNKRGENKVVT